MPVITTHTHTHSAGTLISSYTLCVIMFARTRRAPNYIQQRNSIRRNEMKIASLAFAPSENRIIQTITASCGRRKTPHKLTITKHKLSVLASCQMENSGAYRRWKSAHTHTPTNTYRSASKVINIWRDAAPPNVETSSTPKPCAHIHSVNLMASHTRDT